MKDGSKETLDGVSPIFMSTNKNNSRRAIYLRTYGAGWLTFLFRGSSPGKRGQQKLFGIPTFRGPSAKMSIFHLPVSGSQSNYFIFQMKKPDTDSGPLLPILLHSKAETRYVHGMGALQSAPGVCHGCQDNRLCCCVVRWGSAAAVSLPAHPPDAPPPPLPCHPRGRPSAPARAPWTGGRPATGAPSAVAARRPPPPPPRRPPRRPRRRPPGQRRRPRWPPASPTSSPTSLPLRRYVVAPPCLRDGRVGGGRRRVCGVRVVGGVTRSGGAPRSLRLRAVGCGGGAAPRRLSNPLATAAALRARQPWCASVGCAPRPGCLALPRRAVGASRGVTGATGRMGSWSAPLAGRCGSARMCGRRLTAAPLPSTHCQRRYVFLFFIVVLALACAPARRVPRTCGERRAAADRGRHPLPRPRASSGGGVRPPRPCARPSTGVGGHGLARSAPPSPSTGVGGHGRDRWAPPSLSTCVGSH